MTHSTVTVHGFRHGPMEQKLHRGLYGNRRYRVTELEIPSLVHLQWYWFESGPDFHSRDARRINWFWYGDSKRQAKKYDVRKNRSYDPLRKRWFHLKHEDDIEIEKEMRAGPHGWVYPVLPEIVLPSLDAFFETIRFDYKAKKWF